MGGYRRPACPAAKEEEEDDADAYLSPNLDKKLPDA